VTGPVLSLLAISGSLRAASSNRAALDAARLLAPEGVTVTLYDGLAALPHFNPDEDGEPAHAAVAALRRQVGDADGVMISSPEYARGVPGSLKNALDWLVSGPEMPGKPVMLINTSPRATHAQAALAVTLETMSAQFVREACVTLPLLGRPIDGWALADDPSLAEPLARAVVTFAQAIRAGRAAATQ
jgi:chromate reductase